MRLSLLDELIDRLPRHLARFLEIGPGTGDVSLYLARRFPRVQGTLIDFSPSCTALLRERLVGHNQLTILDGDFRKLAEGDQYDLIVACEVFEHLEDDDSAFAAIANLLHPGGYFIFSAPAFMNKWQNVDVYAGHYRRYERDQLAAKFARHGFDVEQLWCYGFPITALSYPLRQLYYRRHAQDKSLTQEQATQRSGIDRSFIRRFRWLPWSRLLAPFLICQKLVKHTNIGDGFLALVRKPSPMRPGHHAR